MRISRFGNIVANPSTNLSARQSYAVEEVSFKPLAISGSMITVGTIGLLLALFWKRK